MEWVTPYIILHWPWIFASSLYRHHGPLQACFSHSDAAHLQTYKQKIRFLQRLNPEEPKLRWRPSLFFLIPQKISEGCVACEDSDIKIVPSLAHLMTWRPLKAPIVCETRHVQVNWRGDSSVLESVNLRHSKDHFYSFTNSPVWLRNATSSRSQEPSSAILCHLQAPHISGWVAGSCRNPEQEMPPLQDCMIYVHVTYTYIYI